MPPQLPITVLAGSPGGDEAWLVNRVQTGSGHRRVTAIVPKGSSQSTRAPGVVPTTERLVRLGKGCACCTVRGDLMSKIRRIAAEATADHVVIQAPAHSDLVTLAKTFTVADDQGDTLASIARIETLALVVDGASLQADLHSSAGGRLVERIELADVVIVRGEAEPALPTLRALNPYARIHADAEELSLDTLRAETPFDLPAAQRRASLTDILDETSPIPIEGVTRFGFRARRPFHPERLHALLEHAWSDVLRARGAFWVASRPNAVGLLDTVAGRTTTTLGGSWWAAIPPEQRPAGDAFRQHLEALWHHAFGDRQQEIAVVGLDLDTSDLRARLERCLVTEDELSRPQLWSSWPHPFPWLEEGR